MTDEPLSEAERLRRGLRGLSPERRALLSRSLSRRHTEREQASRIPVRAPGTDRFVCSPGQERLHFQHQLDPAAVTYLMPVVLRLQGDVSPEALRSALAAMVDRHETLRTGYELDADHRPAQVVRPAGELTVELAVGDAGAEEAAERARRLASLPFDLADPPLLRAGLWHIRGTDEWTFAFCVHHIAVDGWSLGVLVDELAELYGAAVAGEPARLPELDVQYADFAVWQRNMLDGGTAAAQLDHWQRVLTGAPPLELAGDRPRPSRPTFEGASLPLEIGPELTSALSRVAQEENATPFMVLLAAFTVVLHQWSGQSDLVVGTPVAGRPRPELERLVGLFVNTLALRIDLTGAASFRDLVGRVRAVCLDAYGHQDVPFERVVQGIGVGRQHGRPDLPRVLLSLRNVPLGAPHLPGLKVSMKELPRAGTDLDISVELAPDASGGLSGWLVYSTDLFERGTARRMAESLTTVLAAGTDNADLPVRALPTLPPAERDRLVNEISGARTGPAPGRPLAACFERQAARSPEAVAVVADGLPAAGQVSYRELDERANRLAHWLIRSGVRTEDLVGVHLHRSVDLVVAMLAVFKAGAVYLPLDPDHPAGRLEQVVRDAAPRIVLTSSGLAGSGTADGGPATAGGSATADGSAAAGGSATVVVLDAGTVTWDGLPSSPPDVELFPDNAACLLYTSGSTGRPKGVLLTHHGLANRMRWMCDSFAFGPEDVVLHKTPISSDPSLWEMLVPLFTGGRLVLARPGRHLDPRHVVETLRRHRVTACDFVPSMLRSVLDEPGFAESAGDLRVMVCGGEELPPALAERLLSLAPQVSLYNLYGPTEGSCDASVHQVTLPVPASVPIGRPPAGVELHVLDADGRPQPVGVPGELFIGGVQAARGYLGRPGQTAAVFVPHAFRPGQRLYRTGDRVRWRDDGTLEFLGRLDQQLKIHGYRVEPGEVEALLRSHPGVEEAVVRAWPRAGGEHHLAGYLTVPDGTPAPDRDTLRRYLARALATPMIPASYVVLDEFPRLTNGKIDRNALPEPDWGGPASGAERVEPTGALQRVLARIWGGVLGREDVGAEDDFFELGGHSLLATQVVSQTRELFRMDLPLHFFVDTPTVAAFADAVRERGTAEGVDVERIAQLVLRVQEMSADQVGSQLRSSGDGS
ncbi:amino acid adenylation domain-containing protein [Streptomyces sp. NPDC001037]|uniref:non-ribosomal peptide synthetase n=1 Tax=Streptomyces sp. NPDC001037 TaxID=3364542 RepID=UPI00367F3479